jgi:hypothetical protein
MRAAALSSLLCLMTFAASATESVLGFDRVENAPAIIPEFETPFDACIDLVDQYPFYSLDEAEGFECLGVPNDAALCVVKAHIDATDPSECRP